MEIAAKRALVTGGSLGIGRAIAAALKREGGDVLICGRGVDALAQAQSELGVRTLQCDVADEVQVRALVDHIGGEWGGLDLLVNNAGIQCYPDFTQEVAWAEIRREIAVNLEAPIRLVQQLMPLLQRSPEAAIVNVSSGLALLPKRTSPVYGATKAALHSFTISLRWQLEATRIHVMEVLPPVVRTAMTEGRNDGAIGPEAVAASVVKGLRRNAEEVLVGQSWVFAWVIRIAPWLAQRIMKKQ